MRSCEAAAHRKSIAPGHRRAVELWRPNPNAVALAVRTRPSASPQFALCRTVKLMIPQMTSLVEFVFQRYDTSTATLHDATNQGYVWAVVHRFQFSYLCELSAYAK